MVIFLYAVVWEGRLPWMKLLTVVWDSPMCRASWLFDPYMRAISASNIRDSGYSSGRALKCEVRSRIFIFMRLHFESGHGMLSPVWLAVFVSSTATTTEKT